jgi:hypothetical protein
MYDNTKPINAELVMDPSDVSLDVCITSILKNTKSKAKYIFKNNSRIRPI